MSLYRESGVSIFHYQLAISRLFVVRFSFCKRVLMLNFNLHVILRFNPAPCRHGKTWVRSPVWSECLFAVWVVLPLRDCSRGRYMFALTLWNDHILRLNTGTLRTLVFDLSVNELSPWHGRSRVRIPARFKFLKIIFFHFFVLTRVVGEWVPWKVRGG